LFQIFKERFVDFVLRCYQREGRIIQPLIDGSRARVKNFQLTLAQLTSLTRLY